MTFRQKIVDLIDRLEFRNLIIGAIIFNAVLLGMETSPRMMGMAGPLIRLLADICLFLFVVEIIAKIVGYGPRVFFRDGWNVFDFIVIAISLIPTGGGLSVVRALRILRVLRVLSITPRLRRVIEGFIMAIPGMGSVILLMIIVYYIAAVMATRLFGESFPDWFGTILLSSYTLFEIMTFDSWSSGISRSVMEIYPYAWAFFVPFIVFTAFAVMNLLVGLVVSSMQEAHSEESTAATDVYRETVMNRLEAIEAMLAEQRTQPKAADVTPPAKVPE